MSSEYAYTALIDVLSYKYRLETDIQKGEEAFKKDLELSLSVFDHVNMSVFNVQAISDTVIITCNTHDKFPDFLSIIKKVFVSFLRRGLFVRGGVAYSKHFQNGRLTYSHAIARSYEIESLEAVFPRIVIDNNILDMYRSSSRLPEIFNQNFFQIENGTVYLDIINESNWNEIYEAARKIFIESKDHLVRNISAYTKHLWFERYLFNSEHADECVDRYIPSSKSL